MKFNEPSEFFRFILERADINVINDNQKCLALALDLLDSEKPYFNLLKIAFIFNAYKELVKAYKADSKAKSVSINKAVKTLHEKCFIEKDKAIWAVGWLASVIYPTEWKTFSNQAIAKEEDEEIVWEKVNTTKRDSYNEKSNIHEPTPIIIGVDRDNNNQNNIFSNKILTLDDINLEMIYCPAGSFMMGSPIDELGRQDDEIQHKVTISKPFYIGKYEVTQKQYQKILGNNPSRFKGENNPVECVNWYDAKEFCEKLYNIFKNKLPTGYIFSLPSEAQWEYACRAGTTTSLNSGKNITSKIGSCYNLDEIGWYTKNSGDKTHAVGQKKPNAWGIYDMHGNVWEWCEDWYGSYPNITITDPTGPNSGSDRVFRGGGWSDCAGYCRSACRFSFNPGNMLNSLGFRFALVPVE